MNLNRQQIQAFVGEPYYSRGVKYCKEGMIQILYFSENMVNAKVVGNLAYQVSIKLYNGNLQGNCSCPAFRDHGPCKHIAATCLTAIAKKEGTYRTSEECMDRISELENLEKMLKKKTKEELVEFFITLSNYYPEIVHELNEMDKYDEE